MFGIAQQPNETRHYIYGVANSANVAVATSAGRSPAIWQHALPRSDADWLEFSLLATQWKRQTAQSSSLREIFASKYYKKILELGQADTVVPLIIKQLISEGSNPYHWFAALVTLTKENPMPKTSSVRDISSAWIDWGRARYGRQLGPR